MKEDFLRFYNTNKAREKRDLDRDSKKERESEREIQRERERESVETRAYN